VTALHLDVALAGVGWLAAGTLLYVAFRRHEGLDLVTTRKGHVEQAVTEHEAAYNSILVHFEEDRYVPEVMQTAMKMAAPRSRGIHVLVTIPVPANSPIDAELREHELAAQSVIEQAKVLGGRIVTGHWEKVRSGQTGRMIIDEAREMRADAIVMALPKRGGGRTTFGKTVETVLAKRPCRVIVESLPQDGADAKGSAPVAVGSNGRS
jgi:APA family basic amino acid/polyamine antiporter